MDTDDLGPHEFIETTDMKRLEKIKKTVSNGTYAVPVEELAPRLMRHMLQVSTFHETSIGDSTTRLEPEDQLKAPERLDGRADLSALKHAIRLRKWIAGPCNDVQPANTTWAATFRWLLKKPAEKDDTTNERLRRSSYDACTYLNRAGYVATVKTQ